MLDPGANQPVPMTAKKFYDWQTAGGADNVSRMVNALESAERSWCVIDGIAVNHWAEEPMVTRDVDSAVTADDVERVTEVLTGAGFRAESFPWSVNFQGRSEVSVQLSTEEVYQSFPQRSIAADVHGILMRVASLEDTLKGKFLAWRDDSQRQSKRAKDFTDIVRLVEAHPALWDTLDSDLQDRIDRPPGSSQ